MFKEKRQEKRLNINIPAKFKLPDKNSIYETLIHDISKKGMRIMSKVTVQNKNKLEFEIDLLNDNKSIVSTGHIVWIKPHRFGNGFYEIGLRFNGLKKEHKEAINNFLKQYNLS